MEKKNFLFYKKKPQQNQIQAICLIVLGLWGQERDKDKHKKNGPGVFSSEIETKENMLIIGIGFLRNYFDNFCTLSYKVNTT